MLYLQVYVCNTVHKTTSMKHVSNYSDINKLSCEISRCFSFMSLASCPHCMFDCPGQTAGRQSYRLVSVRGASCRGAGEEDGHCR